MHSCLDLFIPIISVEYIGVVLNKVAGPAHRVENLPRANQKTKKFQYDYHPFYHVHFFFS